jgi:hypothetical protein
MIGKFIQTIKKIFRSNDAGMQIEKSGQSSFDTSTKRCIVTYEMKYLTAKTEAEYEAKKQTIQTKGCAVFEEKRIVGVITLVRTDTTF